MTLLKKSKAVLALSVLLAAPAAAEETSFSGIFIGAEGGYDSSKFNGGSDGTVYIGGIAGYRFQTYNNLVLGIEGTYGKNNYDGFGGFDFSTVDYGNEWSVSATAGIAFGDDSQNLIFGKIGYMETRRDIINDETSAVTKDKDTGLRFGGGYERKFLENFSVRLSADYAKPDDFYKQFQAKAAFILSF